MKSTARKTRPKQTAGARARAHDRRLLAKAEREAAEGTTKAPAELMSEGQERIKQALKSSSSGEYQQARDALANISVPMTLSEICEVIGRDCKPERFGVTALESLAGQLDGLTSIAYTNEGTGTYDQWRVVDNVVARMRLAANVAAWLETETPEAATKLPNVQP
jgi:hypothetical protein